MDSTRKTKLISERDYIRDIIIARRTEAVWQTQFTGKHHLVIPCSDFSVTLCGRTVITKDYFDIEGWTPPVKSNKCKQCAEAELIK